MNASAHNTVEYGRRSMTGHSGDCWTGCASRDVRVAFSISLGDSGRR
jgi:hypothetical protein